MSFLESKRAPWVLVAALMLVAYARVAGCGFIWDDDDYVTNNPVLRTIGGLYDIWFVPTSLPQYYPLVHTTFWLEHAVWGLDPMGYHVVNVALHGASALALLRIGRRLAVPGILFGALWFAVHPVHVESVAWVTERKNVLSLLCYLLAAERWLKWHDGDGGKSYAIGSLWFVGALFSKTVTASLPAALLVVIWWRDGKLTARAWRAALPWLLIGAGLGYFTVHLEATHVGAAGQSWQLAGLERVLVAGRACWFYVYSLIWPLHTCFNYPRWDVDVAAASQWLFPIGAALAVVAAWALRARIGRGPAAALMIFGGTLFPAIGFFDVYPFRYSFVADHFQYHASVAVMVALAAFVTTRTARLAATARLGAAAVFLLGTAVVASLDVGQYRDFETLWRVTLEKNPRSAIAHTNLGAVETDAYGQAKQAGRMRDAAGHLAAAERHLRQVLELDATSHEARTNLGVLAQQQGKRVEARRLYREALDQKRDDAGTWSNLAALEIEEGRASAALPHVQQALSLDPDHVNARIVRGWALCELRRFGDAKADLEWVLRRAGASYVGAGYVDDVQRRYATCLLELKDHRGAAEQALSLLRRLPQDPDARSVMARALAQLCLQYPEDKVRRFVQAGLQRAGLDFAEAAALVAAQLRALGDEGRARRLEGS